MWYDMIWYDMIWYDVIWYDMIWYDMIWYGNTKIQCNIKWYCMSSHDLISYHIHQYDVIWYNMISYCSCKKMWYDIDPYTCKYLINIYHLWRYGAAARLISWQLLTNQAHQAHPPAIQESTGHERTAHSKSSSLLPHWAKTRARIWSWSIPHLTNWVGQACRIQCAT